MREIIPTILTKDPVDLKNKLTLLEGIAPKVQIDVTDGIFVDNKTLGLEALVGLETSLGIEVHLMVKNPIGWVERCRKVAAERVVAQVEMMPNIESFLREVTASGMEVGLALELATPADKVPPEIYSQLDLVLLMAGRTGFGGQDFNPRVLEKIKKVKEIVGDLVEIGVDIGLDEKKIIECRNLGVSVFCVGKTFWAAENLNLRYSELKKLIE